MDVFRADETQGGGLANPASQYPRIFGGVPFWSQYPYALPTFATGFIVLSGTLSSLFLTETLKRKPDGTSLPEPPMSTLEVLKAPGVGIVLYIFGHTMLLALAYTAVSPVMMYTSVAKGGFGFSDQHIAVFMALAGASQALWMLIAFPPLQRNLSTGAVLRGCAIVWPFFMALYPVMNEFLRNDWTLAFYIVAPIGIVIGSGVAMAFSEAASSSPALERSRLLTSSSLCPTLHKRHLALLHRPRHNQRLIAHSQ